MVYVTLSYRDGAQDDIKSFESRSEAITWLESYLQTNSQRVASILCEGL